MAAHARLPAALAPKSAALAPIYVNLAISTATREEKKHIAVGGVHHRRRRGAVSRRGPHPCHPRTRSAGSDVPASTSQPAAPRSQPPVASSSSLLPACGRLRSSLHGSTSQSSIHLTEWLLLSARSSRMSSQTSSAVEGCERTFHLTTPVPEDKIIDPEVPNKNSEEKLTTPKIQIVGISQISAQVIAIWETLHKLWPRRLFYTSTTIQCNILLLCLLFCELSMISKNVVAYELCCNPLTPLVKAKVLEDQLY